jgi:hypothetical protein
MNTSYSNELELEQMLKGINSTLKRINNLSYKFKFTDVEKYKKYRTLFQSLQIKRNQAKNALKEVRLANVMQEASEYLNKELPKI